MVLNLRNMIGKFNKNGFQWDFNIFTFSTTSPVSPYLGFTFQDHFLYPRHQIFWRNKLTLWRICNIRGPLDRKSLLHVRMKNSKVFVILLLVAHWMKFYKKSRHKRNILIRLWQNDGDGHLAFRGLAGAHSGAPKCHNLEHLLPPGGPRKRYLFRDY